MSKKLMKIPAILSMSSIEIADLTGKRHDNVIRDIEKMFNELEIGALNYQGTYKTAQNKRVKCYNLDKHYTMVLVSGYFPKLRDAVFRRMAEMEKEIEELKLKLEERKDSKQLYRHMTDVIKDVRSVEGKETKFWHYSNEADMINRIIFGMSAKEFREFHNVKPDAPIRDMMTKLELEAINRLQNVNESLYQCGFDLKTRREKLESIFDKYFNKRMEKERLRIDA